MRCLTGDSTPEHCLQASGFTARGSKCRGNGQQTPSCSMAASFCSMPWPGAEPQCDSQSLRHRTPVRLGYCKQPKGKPPGAPGCNVFVRCERTVLHLVLRHVLLPDSSTVVTTRALFLELFPCANTECTLGLVLLNVSPGRRDYYTGFRRR